MYAAASVPHHDCFFQQLIVATLEWQCQNEESYELEEARNFTKLAELNSLSRKTTLSQYVSAFFGDKMQTMFCDEQAQSLGYRVWILQETYCFARGVRSGECAHSVC